MKDVNVTDVSTLDRFASGLDSFSRSYASSLRLVYTAADEDIMFSKNIISKIETELDKAKVQKERAERELDNYINNCRWDEREPDQYIVSDFERAIEDADRHLNAIKRILEEAELLNNEVRHLAHDADSYMSYASEIENLCDETTKTTRNAADSIRKYI